MKHVILILFTLSFGLSLAQETNYYTIKRYTSENGLPHSLVFDITQDNNGFLWFATNNGLARFDGQTFKTYRPKLNSTNSISGKSIYRIYSDFNNNLWIAIQGKGLDFLNTCTQNFTNFSTQAPNQYKISGDIIHQIYQSKDSTIYISNNSGIEYYDKKTKQFVLIFGTEQNENIQNMTDGINNDVLFIYQNKLHLISSQKKALPFSEYYKLKVPLDTNIIALVVHKQNLWISSASKGLYCIDLKKKTSIQHHNQINGLAELFITKNGTLFGRSTDNQNKLAILANARKQNQPISYKSLNASGVKNLFNNYSEDHQGNVWISNGRGLRKIDSNFNVIPIAAKNTTEKNILQSTIYYHFMDDHENIWVSPERNGIAMINPNENPFKTYHHHSDPALSGNNISMVYEDSRGKLWVGCHSLGITCYDPDSKSSHSIPYNANDIKKIIYAAASGITEDFDGNLWIGFYDGQLLKLNPQTFAITYFNKQTKAANYFKGYSIRSLFTDPNGNIWIATNSSGLVEFNYKTKKFIYHSEKFEKNYLANSHYRFITQTNDGNIWTATQSGGLGKYDPLKKTFTHYITSNTSGNISSNTVYHISEENDSLLWVGTANGLNLFNTNTESFIHFPIFVNDHLCSVYRIFRKEHFLWLSSDHGIHKFNTRTKKYTTFTKEDGLPGNEFNTTAGHQSKNGDIYLGS